MPLTRRALLAAPALTLNASPARAAGETLLVTNSASDTVGFVDLAAGTMEEVVCGAAPWGIARSSSKRAYVATAEGVAAIDLASRERRFLAPYRSWSGPPSTGEYRPGGMGIAAAPDGSRIYTAVYLPDGPSVLEVLDVATRQVVAAVPVGLRPFRVLVSRDGAAVYTVDHDSYTVTVVDTATFEPRTLPAAPLGDENGLAGFEKPHDAALAANGDLLLPFQGQVLLRLDPATGESKTMPLTANTHQHGIAILPPDQAVAIVGTGPAGGATGDPSLTVLDLRTSQERVYPLERPHEACAWLTDPLRVVLTGGYTFGDGGWDGLTVVDLAGATVTEFSVGARPLDIALL